MDETDPLDRAEQRQLVNAELSFDVAKEWVRENGYRLEEKEEGKEDPDLPF